MKHLGQKMMQQIASQVGEIKVFTDFPVFEVDYVIDNEIDM